MNIRVDSSPAIDDTPVSPEKFSYRIILKDYFRRGARWTGTEPELSDELFDPDFKLPTMARR